MKIKYLLIAVLAGAALVGCNREPGVEDLKENGKHSYMGFTITTPAMTKAENTGNPGTFLVGENYENWINTIYFFFYKDGAYVSWGYGEVGNDFKPDGDTPGTTGDEIEEILHDGSSAKNGVVVMESTMTMPNQVLCVINSRNPSFYRNKSLETVLASLQTGDATSLTGQEVKTVREPSTTPETDFWYEAGGKSYFVMLNAPMRGKNKQGDFEIKYATDIPDGAIKETREAAKQNPVNVYVERMAARLEITNLDNTTAGILDSEGYIKTDNFYKDLKEPVTPGSTDSVAIYQIKPLAWGVTAVNQKGNILKKAEEKWWTGSDTDKAPFAGTPSWLESGTGVPNVLHPGENMFPRINWTTDPNHANPLATNRDSYPHSARELFTANELRYYSAIEIKEHYDESENGKPNDIRQRYALENTFSQLGQNDPRIPGTMLLLYAQGKKRGATSFEDLYAYLGQMYNYGQYVEHVVSSIQSNGYEFYLDEDKTKKLTDVNFANPAETATYVDPTTYFETKKAAKYENVFSNNPSSIADLTIVKSGNDDTKYMPDLYRNWVIELQGTFQPKDFDSGFPEIPTYNRTHSKGYSDGYVTLVPVSSKTLYLENPAYDPAVPGSKKCVPATTKQLVEAFLGCVIEPANRYEEGKMYYAIPIEHFGKAKASGEHLEGNYGVVRNNLYDVKIGMIRSLGHGISDPDEPIVPGDRKKTLYIAAKINILSWQIASQTADLQE